MFWRDVQGKSGGVFKRLTAVKQYIALNRKHPSRGATVEVQLLMYYREYRTFLHTATSYGYSESQGWRIVRTMEDILIKSGVFRLPGKKALLKMEREVLA
ncbi:MAG: transposase family protein, partial [Flavisolibacter sp.]|nr:transposase family protein [Flavisolibacter sp.]